MGGRGAILGGSAGEPAAAGGLSIGGAIGSGTATRVLFEDTGPVLADSAALTFTTGSGTLSATILQATGLTSGRVPFVTTSGVLTDSANMTFSGANFSASGTINGTTGVNFSNNWTVSASGNAILYTMANSKFVHQFTRTAPTTLAQGFMLYSPGNSTAQTASTEISNFSYPTFSRQWSTGALTTQREHLIAAPTYTFVGASTITNAATVAVTAAPIASTNATITNAYALWVQADKSRFDGRVVTNAPNSAIADADTVASSFSFYLNEAGNLLTVKVKYADGTTIKTGSIALV